MDGSAANGIIGELFAIYTDEKAESARVAKEAADALATLGVGLNDIVYIACTAE